jgi:3-methyl-2-oxobutanoate hydroxymethyltransferase
MEAQQFGGGTPSRPAKVTIPDVVQAKRAGRKITMMTAYDTAFAKLVDASGIDIILVGDSLGMVVLGYPTTVPVTMDDMVRHAAAVSRGASRPLLVGDMPFGSYQASVSDAISNASEFLRAGMHCVKLEGGGHSVEVVRALVDRGIPAMGHLGLTPQSVNALGGYKVQGRGDDGDRLLADAHALAEAGAFSTVLECVPAELGRRVTEEVGIPTIGIGAGPHTDGQVLVLQDLLGLTPGPAPRFVKRYADLASKMTEALQLFAKEVDEGSYPTEAESYR